MEQLDSCLGSVGSIGVDVADMCDGFSCLSDEELVTLCKFPIADTQEAISTLIARYKKSVRRMALSRATTYADADDLMQEGFLALIDAALSFLPEKGVQFHTYSYVCIANRMTTAKIKNNRSVLSGSFFEQGVQLEDHFTPLSILLEKERARELAADLAVLLSRRELDVFRLFLSGSTYDQMARRLNISSKTVDNALQRVRRKLKSIWRTDHFAFENDSQDFTGF